MLVFKNLVKNILLITSIQISFAFVANNEHKVIDDVKRFWQLTDVHWDVLYNQNGDVLNMCHKNTNLAKENSNNGLYGNYLCDSPWLLVEATLKNMKKIEPLPNFILWTGDNAPHSSDSSSFPIIFNTIKNVTLELQSLFGDEVAIIPILGNHDTSPKDEYPESSAAFYGKYLDEGGWSRIIPVDGHEDFKRGGYFKYPISEKLSVLVLNTNLYYVGNKLGTHLKDPGQQFKWMRNQFEEAKKSDSKVLVTAHSPPGFFERFPSNAFLNESYNDYYVDLFEEFGSVIVSQIYGHLHTDSFRIFRSSQDNLKSSAFMAPSVTPWCTNKMIGGTGINPSIRLYELNDSSMLDYTQYHLNLTKANHQMTDDGCLKSPEGCDAPSFEEYYKATEFFGVKSLDVPNLELVYEKLVSNDSFFQEMYVHNSGGYDPQFCNEICRRKFLCSLVHLKTPLLKNCLNSNLNVIDELTTESFHIQQNASVTNTTKAPSAHASSSSFIYPTSFGVYEKLYTRNFMNLLLGFAGGVSIIGLVIAVLVFAFLYKKRNILAAGHNMPQWGGRSHGGYRPLNVEAD